MSTSRAERSRRLAARRVYRLCCGVEYSVAVLGYHTTVQDILNSAHMSRRQFYQEFVCVEAAYDAMHAALVALHGVTGLGGGELLALPFPSAQLPLFSRGRSTYVAPIVGYDAALTHATARARAGMRDTPPAESFAVGTALRAWCDDVASHGGPK